VLYRQSIYGWDRTSAYTEKITLYSYCVGNNSNISFQSNPYVTFNNNRLEQFSKDCWKITTKAKLLSPSQAHYHFQPNINQLLNSWSPLIIFTNKSVRSKSKIKHIRLLLNLKGVTQTSLLVRPIRYLSVIIIGRVVTHHFLITS